MVHSKHPHRLPSPTLTDESMGIDDSCSLLNEFSKDQRKLFANHPSELAPVSNPFSDSARKRIHQIQDAIVRNLKKNYRGVPSMISLVCIRPRRPRRQFSKDMTKSAPTARSEQHADRLELPKPGSERKRTSDQLAETNAKESKRRRVASPSSPSRNDDLSSKSPSRGPFLDSNKAEVVEQYLKSLPGSQESVPAEEQEPFSSFPNDLPTSTPKPRASLLLKSIFPSTFSPLSRSGVPWPSATPRPPNDAGLTGPRHLDPNIPVLGSPLFPTTVGSGDEVPVRHPVSASSQPSASNPAIAYSLGPGLTNFAALLEPEKTSNQHRRSVKPVGSAPELAGYGVKKPDQFHMPIHPPISRPSFFQEPSPLALFPETFQDDPHRALLNSPSSPPGRRFSSESRIQEIERLSRPSVLHRRSSSSNGDVLFNSQLDVDRKLDDIAQFINFDVSSGEVA